MLFSKKSGVEDRSQFKAIGTMNKQRPGADRCTRLPISVNSRFGERNCFLPKKNGIHFVRPGKKNGMTSFHEGQPADQMRSITILAAETAEQMIPAPRSPSAPPAPGRGVRSVPIRRG